MNSENYKKQIEAVLFTVGRPLSTAEIAEMLSLGSVGMVKEAVTKLLDEYSQKDSALEILQDVDKFRMNIKGEHMHLIKDLMPVTELNKPTTETLAIIAWKQPVLQSEVVKIRGNKTYEHMKILLENEFVSAEPKGLSKMLKLTPKFYQYFDTNKDKIKQQLEDEASKNQMPDLPDPSPSTVPSDEMPTMPGQDINPEDIQLEEKENKKEGS